jgi:hypothetical protein
MSDPADLDVHVAPIGDKREHVLARWCWCEPRIEFPCADCDAEGCWKCNKGWTRMRNPHREAVVIHAAEDGRE